MPAVLRHRLRSATAAVLLAATAGACDSNSPTPSPSPTPTSPPVNQPPAFTSASTVSVAEDVSTTTTIYQAAATDPEGSGVTYTIGGTDAALFSMTSAGALRFLASPDFELPRDNGLDNVYDVQITASDGQASAALALKITVTNNLEGITATKWSLDDVALSQLVGFYTPIDQGIGYGGYIFAAQRNGLLGMVSSFNNSPLWRYQIPDVAVDSERGLIAIAPAPEAFDAPGYMLDMYASTSGDIVIRRYRRFDETGFGSPSSIEVLRIPHAQYNNNMGGWLGSGPDGNLYVATGDAGGSGDPTNSAQDSTSRLGKVLRISPDFATVTVVAKGLRNPSGGTFYNNMLVLGDRGESQREEINLIPLSGGTVGNYGWPYKEGSLTVRAGAPAGIIDPVLECPHQAGPRGCYNIVTGLVAAANSSVVPWRGKLLFMERARPDRGGALFAIPASRLVLGQPTIQSSEFEWLTNDAFDTPGGSFDPSAMNTVHDSGRTIAIANYATGRVWYYTSP